MKIKLDHGAGGYLSREILDDIIIPTIKPVYDGIMEDSSIINLNGNHRISFTTDSYVINPIFFGNGDIGKVSVCGTVNDLAVSGATPKYLSLAMILEEELDIDDLKVILTSIRNTCIDAGVRVLAGDTKVVGKGEADKIYINTTGIGVFDSRSEPLYVRNIQEGDSVIVSGFLGNHGIHILSMREGLGYEEVIESDCAPLNHIIDILLEKYGNNIHYIRDLTRGGFGSIINEISLDINKNIVLDYSLLPVQKEAIMATEMLGVSALYLANEGNMCIFCNPDLAEEIINDLRRFDVSKAASQCGKVEGDNNNPQVFLNHANGSSTILDFLKGAELPRLC